MTDDTSAGRPNANTYWVEPGRLLAGEYPRNMDEASSRAKLRAYLEAGVTFFLDLTEEGELTPYDDLLKRGADGRGVVHCRMSIPDLCVPPSQAHMAEILDRVDGALAEGHVVYVHCWGGVGRTGTVVGCYLVRRGMSGEEALATIASHWSTMQKRHRRRRSPETDEQCEWVRNWAERDRR
jgi:protein-tyrosine phosphatase